MINVYEVKFRAEVEIDEESEVGNIITMNNDMDDDENIRIQYGMFHLGCEYLTEAMIKAIEFLDMGIGEGGYELLGVEILDDIHLVNFPEEECPFCAVEDAGEDDIIRFQCKCGHDIVVKETGWKFINCPDCNVEIPRDRVMGTHGNYILLDIDKKEK